MSVTDLKIYTLNLLTLTISFTNVEFIIRFTLVLISIFYTLHKWWLMYEKISKHISWKEGTFSNTAKSLKINNKPTKEIVKNMELVAEKIFEPLREWVGGPIRVNSFYRCEKLNTALKGSKTSSHTKGQAIDIDSLGKKTNAEMYDWIKDNLDFDQLIWEFGNDNPKWLHISYVSKKENRKEILKAVYRGSRLTYYRQ